MVKNASTPTLCWCCAKATGKCSWSDDLIPIKGWVAEPTKVKTKEDGYCESFIVHECPSFVRDSYNNGLERIKKGAV